MPSTTAVVPTTLTGILRDPAVLPAAGLKTIKDGGVPDMLCKHYGEPDGGYDITTKAAINTKNDTSVAHGYKPRVADVRPGYLGGPRAGGDLENYIRKIE